MFYPPSDPPVRSVETDSALPMPAMSAGYGPSSAADPNEGRRFGGAFWVSAGLHGAAIVLLVVLTIAAHDQAEERPAVFELVAGAGDNFGATEAPAGSEAGLAATGEIEFTAPDSVRNWTPSPPPAAEISQAEAVPTPVEPVAPVQQAERVKTPPATDTPVPNFKQTVKDKLRQEKRKVDREIKKQRAAEEAAAKAAAAAAAAEAKRKAAATTYDKFQQQNGSKTTGAKSTAAAGASPGKRIDAGSIKRGVTGGTGAGSSGAGGTALARAEADAMDAYFSMLIQRLRDSHEKPGGLSDLLNAEVQFTVAANGVISGVRILRSSGNAEFDQSVLEAFARVRMPARPDKNTDVQRLTFRIKEA